MAKTFLTIQTELATIWSDKAFSSLSSTAQTQLKLRINLAKDYIVGWPKQFDRQWPFLKTTAYITTTAKHTTGNIDVTQYSANITKGTVSPAFTSAMVERLLIVNGGSEPYRIKTYTDTDNIVLETPYMQSDASAQSYSIVQDKYSLASDFNGMVQHSVKPDGELPLEFRTESAFSDEFPNSTNIGTPLYYGLPEMNSSGVRQIWFREDYPETAMGIQYQYYKMLSDLSADGDISLIGYVQGGDNALLLTAIWQLKEVSGEFGLDERRAAKQDADQAISIMWSNAQNMTEDYHPDLVPDPDYLSL